MDKYEQEFRKRMKGIASSIKVDREELGELRLKRLVAVLYLLIKEREETFDLLVSGGNSGVAAIEIAKVEISLDVARHIKLLDLVMIGSGDSDFLAVRDFALENKKGFIALCFEKGVAWEIRRGYHIFLEDIKAIININFLQVSEPGVE